MTIKSDSADVNFPRQRARTRGFRSGAPRQPTLSPDASRLVFLRSSAGDDARTHLWVADLTTPQTPVERVVADAIALLDTAEGSLPPEEAARRERMREVSEGITSYTVDSGVSRATFVLHGRVYLIDLIDPEAQPLLIPTHPHAVDARLSPDGAHIGYVAERAIHVITVATMDQITLATPSTDHDSWGLADFIAAEEFSRMRGWWWLADSSGIIAEHVDESPVATWWISDPAQPAHQPRPHRYPAAGQANADTTLWILNRDGRRHEITWNHKDFEYLTSVHVSSQGPVVIGILSRDQRTQQILRVSPASAEVTVIDEQQDESWVDVFPGSPALTSDGELIQIVHDKESDTNRLMRAGSFLTPADLDVRGIVQITDTGVVVQAAIDPTQQIPYLVNEAGAVPMVDGGIASAHIAGATAIISHTDLAAMGSTMSICTLREPLMGPTGVEVVATITSHAQMPVVQPNVVLLAGADSQLSTAIVWPEGHQPGTRKLPVLLAPYGGPHARRVLDAGMAYASDQWWANQGYCVVVIDGRGTPGRGPRWERSIAGDLAGPVLADQIAGLDAVLTAFPDDLDGDRVGIHGWSFGGYLAALAVLTRPDRIHAAVAGAPVTEWRLYDTAYTERYLGDPNTNAEAYERSSLLPIASQLTRPLLLIHGLADDNVAAAHTLQLSSALLAAGRTHSVLPLSGVTHMTPQEVVAENLLLAQRDFLGTHLLAAGSNLGALSSG